MDLVLNLAYVVERIQSPCWRTSSGAHVVRCVRGFCCGTRSEFMLKDVFEAHVVGHIVGSCLGLCVGPMFWAIAQPHVIQHGLALYCEMCTCLMMWDVSRAHVVRHIGNSCCGTSSEPIM